MTESAPGAPTQEVTEEDTKSAAGRILASVLDLPGIAGVAEPLLEPFGKALFALAQPLDAVSSTPGIALRLLAVAASQTAREEPSLREVIERESAPPEKTEAPRPDTTPPPWPKLISDLFEELAEHTAADDVELRRTARSALRELGAQITGLKGVALPVPGGGRPENIASKVLKEITERLAKMEKIMSQMEKLFGKISAPRFRFALKMFETEMIQFAPDRAAIAAALSVPGFLVELAVSAGAGGTESGSTLKIGNEVHEYLQREYRSFWVSARFVGRGTNSFVRGAVVQDSKVYHNAINGTPLASAVKSRSDGSLYALLFARLPEYLTRQVMGNERMGWVWSMYREDVLDMRCGEVWEIKPMRSAAIGVFQELQYRHSFNLVNALMQDVQDVLAAGGVKGLLAKRAPFFKGIRYFSRTYPLIPGLDANWMPIKRAFVVGRSEGKPLLAVPMTVPQLPGLVLYLLLALPGAALLALSALLAKAIADAIEKKAREFADLVEETLRVLANVALAALAVFATIVVVLLFWPAVGTSALGGIVALGQLLARFAPALAANAVLGTSAISADPSAGGAASGPESLPRALLELARQSKLKLVAPPVMAGDEIVIQLAPVEQPSKGPRVHVVDIALGNVRVCGLPVSARPIVDALAQMGVSIAAGVFAEFLGEAKAQA